MACVPHLNGQPTTYDAIKKQLLEDRSLLSKYVPNAKTDVPSMPFAKSWKQLGLKLALRKAIESGADSLSWTTGARQAERYDLSKQLNEIGYRKNKDGTYAVHARDKNDQEVLADVYPEDKLEGVVGKDVAAKMIAGEGKLGDAEMSNGDVIKLKRLSGLDLKVGGEGMAGFYDRELPNIARDLVKRWGVRVGEETISAKEQEARFQTRAQADRWANANLGDHDYHLREGTDGMFALYDEYDHKFVTKSDENDKTVVHSLPITEQMKKDVLEKGFPLFMPKSEGKLDQAKIPKSVNPLVVPQQDDKKRGLEAATVGR